MFPSSVLVVANNTTAWYNDPTTFVSVVIAAGVGLYVLYRLAKYIFDHV